MASTDTEHYFFQGGGEMGEIMRTRDWSNTSLGDPGTWPQSLRAMVAVMLHNPFGMYISWGNDYTQLYNDSYRPILGSTKHPFALGNSSRQTFAEVWHIIGPMFDAVMKGEAIGSADFMLPLNRQGFVEECYFDFAYSPIKKENGEVGGVLVTVIETTERKKATEALKQSNVRFLNNIMQAPVAMCVLRGRDYVVEMANERMIEIWGTETAQVLNKPIFVGLPEATNQGIEDLLDKVYNTGERFVANERPVQLPRNGTVQTTYLNFVYEAFKETDGTISGIVATATEVTELVESRLKVEESEQKVRALVDNAPFPIAVYVGEEMRIELANESITNIWGKGRDVIGKTFKEVLPELRNQQVFDQIRQVYFTGVSFHTRNTPLLLEVDGEAKIFYFNYSFTPLYDLNGTIYAVMNTGVDLTDLTLAKKKIEESEKRFRSLTESIPQLIWETDAEGNALFTSGRWEDYTGIKPDGAAEWKHMIHPDDLQDNLRVWSHCLATGEIYRHDVRVRRKDGEYRWHAILAEPVRNDENKITKWVGAFTDIHTEKAFTQELEKLVAERTRELEQNNIDLEKMNKELQSFAYISSHDLQEPLRKIQTFATQILEKDSANLPAGARDKFERMHNAANRMQTLINDLLTYSRANISERVFETTDLAQLIAAVQEDMKEELEHKNATIEVKNTAQLALIPFQFRQLIYNLISNSLKFSKANTAPHILIHSELSNGEAFSNKKLSPDLVYCKISFTDNGIGFEQQYSERIFEVFQRLHGKADYAGTGIGLAIVKKIVENHKGVITAHGAPGAGAGFDIYIPVTK